MACLNIEKYMERSGRDLPDIAQKILSGKSPALCEHGCEIPIDGKCPHGCGSLAVALIQCGETWEDIRRRAAGD